MLKRHERRALRQIEQRLAADDPAFTARMRGLPTEPRFPTVSVLCAALYIATPIVMLLGGAPATLIAFTVFAVAVAVVLTGRRRKARRS